MRNEELGMPPPDPTKFRISNFEFRISDFPPNPPQIREGGWEFLIPNS
jgi:hypothetical protein